ncbi:MAG TPA: hypothetical protein VEI03_01395 [Stellaceae bacterium]|nr:hypothetical protein [Stellaceae bacterium]
MASVNRHGPARRHGGGERRYVASLLWPGRLPRPANDNRRRLHLVPLAACAALLLAALLAVMS